MTTLCLVTFVAYLWTVWYRARLNVLPTFCHDVKHCRWKHHRVVIVAPPNKPLRAVLKHV
jgi:hypothetical protein